MSLPIPPDTVNFLGPLFIGYVVNWCLLGVLSIQTYQYHTDYPHDRWQPKAMVYVVYVLEAFQTFALTSSGLETFGYKYGDLGAADKFGFGWLTVPITSGIVALIAQSFYAYRISVLAGTHKFTPLILFLTLTQFTASLVIAVEIYKIGAWSTLMRGKAVLILAGFWEGGNALCDIVITICMIYYLRKRDHDTNFKRTHAILTRLIYLAMGTGAVTALISVMTLIVTYTRSKIAIYQATGCILGKLYSVSMLVVLNARTRKSDEELSSISNEMLVILPPSHGGGSQGSATQTLPPEDDVTLKTHTSSQMGSILVQKHVVSHSAENISYA